MQGCAITKKDSGQVFQPNPDGEKVEVFFQAPVIMGVNLKTIKNERDALPEEIEVNVGVLTRAKNKLRRQGVNVVDTPTANSVVATIFTSYDFGLHGMMEGIRLLEGRINLKKNDTLLMTAGESWHGAIGASYSRGIESVGDRLADDGLAWIMGKLAPGP